MSTKMCPKQQKTIDRSTIGSVLRRKRRSFKRDDILTEFWRVGFMVQSLGMGEPVPRHTGTETTVFREKQKSSVAGHWGKEWMLGEAGLQLEGQTGSTLQKAFWTIDSPWEFPTEKWFELASLLRIWPWEKGRGWIKEKELQGRVAGPKWEARTGRPYSTAPVLGSLLGQQREVWAVRAGYSRVKWFQLQTDHATLGRYPNTFNQPMNTKSRNVSFLVGFGGFPGDANGKEPACQCRRCKRCEFNPWVRKIPWRRTWQPTPVFFPGKFHGQRSLVNYSPWGCIESDMSEATYQAHTGQAQACPQVGLLYNHYHGAV